MHETDPVYKYSQKKIRDPHFFVELVGIIYHISLLQSK